ncbi:MAG: hypothetical protein A3H27_15300 [Acidobacteria bacterium RIFCSPLOWO2_02_FULL_59_13]|nr:MAG: hypothetical protein A3H27_15300 [Acidobacteria bacterium RIFCSPLOWO2_02_FULL_59_13]
MKQSWFEKSVRVGLFAGLLLAGVLANAQVQTVPEPAAPVVGTPGNYLVTFQPGTSQADRAASVRNVGAALRFNYSIVESVAVTVPNVNVFAALQRDPSVLKIIVDHPVFAFQGNGQGKGKPGGGGGGEPTDDVVQPGVLRVGAPTSGSNGNGVGVAIVDTGIDFNHPDLAGAIDDTQSFTAYASCQDDHGHGTHVAGIVGARDNTIDVVGVAPMATLYCAKVLDSTGSGWDSDITAALDWVATDGQTYTPPIRVVNMSLGRSKTADDTDDHPMRVAVKNLYQQGVAVVVAAGNDSTKEVSQMVPAGYPEVLAVASSTAVDGTNNRCRFFTGTIAADTASSFTTDGAGVAISAPGEEAEDVNKPCFVVSKGILSLKLGGGTTRMSGTSMASPHVAGIVARLIQMMGYGGNRAPGYRLNPAGVEDVRTDIRANANAFRVGDAPLDPPPGISYTFDGEREGIAKAP